MIEKALTKHCGKEALPFYLCFLSSGLLNFFQFLLFGKERQSPEDRGRESNNTPCSEEPCCSPFLFLVGKKVIFILFSKFGVVPVRRNMTAAIWFFRSCCGNQTNHGEVTDTHWKNVSRLLIQEFCSCINKRWRQDKIVDPWKWNNLRMKNGPKCRSLPPRCIIMPVARLPHHWSTSSIDTPSLELTLRKKVLDVKWKITFEAYFSSASAVTVNN